MNAIVAARSPAGFWKRYVAYFIDVVLVYIVLELLARLLFAGQEAGELDQLRTLTTALQNQQMSTEEATALLARMTTSLAGLLAFSSVAYVVIAGAYFALLESSAWQATFGKRLLGIKVVDADGKRIGIGRALGRFFAAGLSWLSLNIGHAMAAWTPERRAMHDYIADTRVENTDPARPQMPLWGWLIVGAHALLLVLGILGFMLAAAMALKAASQV